MQNPRGALPNIYNISPTAHDPTYTPTTGGTTCTVTLHATTVVWEVGSGMLLKSGEKVRVTVDLNQIVTGSHHAGEVMKNEEFVVVVKPHIGSVLDISRVAPAEVTEVNDLG